MKAGSGFHYTKWEIEEIVKLLKSPTWPEGHDNWHAILGEQTHEQYRKRDFSGTKRYLEEIAHSHLIELRERSDRKSSVEKLTDEIADQAENLHKLLQTDHPMRGNFGRAFGEIEGIPVNDTGEVQLMWQLEMLFKGVEDVRESYRIWSSKQPDKLFEEYADSLLLFYTRWTGKEPGGGKAGGPASRFLLAAANPFIRFCDEVGLKIKRENKQLTEESAGELITRIKRRRDSEENQGV